MLFLGSPYVSDGREYTFFINVCGDTKVSLCNNKEAAVCQEKKADSTQVKIAGRHQNQTLRWVRVKWLCGLVSHGSALLFLFPFALSTRKSEPSTASCALWQVAICP